MSELFQFHYFTILLPYNKYRNLSSPIQYVLLFLWVNLIQCYIKKITVILRSMWLCEHYLIGDILSDRIVLFTQKNIIMSEQNCLVSIILLGTPRETEGYQGLRSQKYYWQVAQIHPKSEEFYLPQLTPPLTHLDSAKHKKNLVSFGRNNCLVKVEIVSFMFICWPNLEPST